MTEPPAAGVPALPDACWPVDWACADAVWLAELDPVVQARSAAMATQVLRSLTAYQVGGCPVMVRPCASGCGGGTYVSAPVPGAAYGALGGPVGAWWPHIADGQWVNTACGCTASCSCTTVPEVILPGPVGAVVDVIIDGAALDPYAYRVDDANHLVRQDGGVWPKCQDMAAPAGDVNTFYVVYFNNVMVDGLGSWVAGVLAVEFAKACTGEKCRLPSGVQSISRLGISLEIPSGMFDGGVTGIREVDAWVRLWNPNAARMPSQVWSPDLHRARRSQVYP